MFNFKFYLSFLTILMISVITSAAAPENFSVCYQFKNPDGSIFRKVKYFLLESSKFRTEYYSGVQAVIQDTTMTVEYNKDNEEPHTIEILRKDKGLVWTLYVEHKDYSANPLQQDSWGEYANRILIDNSVEWKKKGETNLLNYQCDIYENTQTVQEDTWTNIYYVTSELGVVLKSEMYQNGKLVQTMDALEFNTEKPSSALFEIPEGYSKYENNGGQ